MSQNVVLLDSVTDKSDTARGAIVVCGSHGGLNAAMLAACAGYRAVVLNDAGIGLDGAGTQGVERLAEINMAAAAVDCMSAEIGCARDMLENGIISCSNDVAELLGVKTGMPVNQAVILLQAAPKPVGTFTVPREHRWQQVLAGNGLNILCVDSASLITPEDAGRIIITGSHGGLIGGDPKRACKAPAKLVAFSDAGLGKNDVGIARLPALDGVGVGALTVDCNSCQIGSAASVLDYGIVSAVNPKAAELGIPVGIALKSAISNLGS